MVDVVFVNSTEKRELRSDVNGTLLLATKLLQADISAQIARFGEYKNYDKDYPAFLEEIVCDLIRRNARCVSFYTLWPHYHVMLRIAKELKARKPELFIVFGGPQSSATAKDTMEAMPFVDFICTGEGENTVVPFFRALLKQDRTALKEIPGLYYRLDGEVCCNEEEVPLCDLNTLPHWDDRLYMDFVQDSEKSLTSNTYFMPIDAGRGCPFSCTFCCTSHFWKRLYRLKSPERILEDIRYYHDKFGIKSFWFSHDAFTTNKKLVEEVCDKLIESNMQIKWRCTARVDCISEDLVLKMKQAGMTHIELGVETGSARMQKLINKNLKLEYLQEMVAFLLKNGIYVGLFFMYGFPEETEEDLQQTLHLLFSLLDMGIGQASMSFCRFNPTTALTEKYLDQLVFDSDVLILARGAWFGYQEELKMLQENKRLFSFYYHLDTPLRNEFQNLFYLQQMYEKFPNTAKMVRKLFGGDDLAFFRAFAAANRNYLAQDSQVIFKEITNDVLDLWYRMIEPLMLPYEKQLKALLRYENNGRLISHSKEDISIEETYDFSYVDFKMKLPIEQYSSAKTRILLEKVNGKKNMKVLNISYDD